MISTVPFFRSLLNSTIVALSLAAGQALLCPLAGIRVPKPHTVQIAIKALQRNISVDVGLAMAGSFFATLPLLVVFVVVGRQMVSGIMDGAFKGWRRLPCPRRPECDE